MRSLWNAVSFVAVVNLLALAMFIGWLGASGRLSEERLEELRSLFARPVAEAQAEAQDAAEEAALQAEQAQEDWLNRNPSASSSAQVAHLARLDQREAQMMRTLRRESDMLLEQLERRARELDEREVALLREREAWEQSVAEAKRLVTDEQFQQAVRQLESLPGRQAKLVILSLIDGGRIDQAVAYLDAMQSRAATKVLKEFKTGPEIELAAELLERLRTHGLPQAGGVLAREPDDDSAAQPDAYTTRAENGGAAITGQ